MFRTLSSDHHQGSITVLVQLPLIGVHASSYSGMWLYVVCASVHTMYLSVWCLVMYCPLASQKIPRIVYAARSSLQCSQKNTIGY